MLFNRDLRLRDNPALAAAARAERAVPLFVLDERLLGSRCAAPNRVTFMLEALADLDAGLRRAGGRLFVRRGDPVAEALAVAAQCGAGELHVSADHSAYARAREERLARACAGQRIAFHRHPGATVVPPGAVTPAGGDHFRVFTPYHRAWSRVPPRPHSPAPRALSVPSRPAAGRLPLRSGAAGPATLRALASGLPATGPLLGGTLSPGRARGGETEGRRLMRAFLREGLASYEERRDDLAADATSRLSPHLRFGCVSPLELTLAARGRPGGEPFARQLCWRDFHHQVLAANPSLPHRDYRPRGDRWSRSRRALEAWREGRTGYPLVDAAMRQLAAEGFMHNRARMTVASFLAKDLHLDWRAGAAHFWDLLSDGDLASNAGNWQWIAGTGNDTRPNRVLNPLRQAERFDPDGAYVRRHLPELESVSGRAVHRPWLLEGFGRLRYPPPIVDHDEAAAAFRARRGA